MNSAALDRLRLAVIKEIEDRIAALEEADALEASTDNGEEPAAK